MCIRDSPSWRPWHPCSGNGAGSDRSDTSGTCTGCIWITRHSRCSAQFARRLCTACTTWSGSSGWFCVELPGSSSGSPPKEKTMSEDLDQLAKSLKLAKIRSILPRELDRAVTQGTDCGEFLSRLLREEFHYRQERSIEYRIKLARMPERWSIDTFPFAKQPGVKAATIKGLARLDFIAQGTNLVFIGPTGVGKTGLASAILLKAIQNGYKGLFFKAQDLFDDMYASLADRGTRKLVDRLARVDLLLVDELGFLNLKSEQTNIFFKLMEERYNKKSTIITTNMPYDDWYNFLGNKHMVGALLDRLRHRCQTITIDGPSLRAPTES